MVAQNSKPFSFRGIFTKSTLPSNLTCSQQTQLERIQSKKMSTLMFDESLQKYVNIEKELDSKVKFKLIQSLRLNLEPLTCTLQDYAKSWINDLGALQHEQSKLQMHELKAELDVRYFGSFPFLPPPPSELSPSPVEAVAAATSVHVFIHWIRLSRVSRQCTQFRNLKYLPRS